METLYAIQWQDPQTDLWATCRKIDEVDEDIACIFFSKDTAQYELEQWDDGGVYRMVEIQASTQ